MGEKMNVTNESTFGEVQGKESNVILGIIGAVVGAFLGSIVWFFIYQLGYIASIAGLAIIVGAYKGYVLLAKKKDLKGVVIATVISIIVLCLVCYFCWGFSLFTQLAEYEITLTESLMLVPEAIAGDEQLIMEFVKEILMGLIIIFVGAVPYFRSVLRERKEQTAVEFQ